LEDIFEKYDSDKDGRMNLDDYVKFLLPTDYIIEDKDEPWSI